MEDVAGERQNKKGKILYMPSNRLVAEHSWQNDVNRMHDISPTHWPYAVQPSFDLVSVFICIALIFILEI